MPLRCEHRAGCAAPTDRIGDGYLQGGDLSRFASLNIQQVKGLYTRQTDSTDISTFAGFR